MRRVCHNLSWVVTRSESHHFCFCVVIQWRWRTVEAAKEPPLTSGLPCVGVLNFMSFNGLTMLRCLSFCFNASFSVLFFWTLKFFAAGHARLSRTLLATAIGVDLLFPDALSRRSPLAALARDSELAWFPVIHVSGDTSFYFMEVARL